MDQLLAIRSFARVAETRSFTKAADSLDMPKATISKLIRNLEAHLGLRLLQRTTRRVTVTADGNSYYEQTAHLLRELEDIDSNLAGAHVKPKGRIRVNVASMPACWLIIPALGRFYERYPEMQIDLGVGDRTVDLVGENVDCVIRGGPITHNSDVARLLGTASWTTCASPAYLRQHGTPKHPNDLLNGHRIVGYHSALTGRPLPSQFVRKGEMIEIDGPYRISVNDGSARVAAGLAGLGIMQTFTYAVKAQLECGELVPILRDWTPARYPFNVVYPPNRKLSIRVRTFIDWLLEIFESLD